MTQTQVRIDEVDRYTDWLTDNGPENYLKYNHGRIAKLETKAQATATRRARRDLKRTGDVS